MTVCSAAVHFLDVPHQGRKGVRIGVAVGIAEGAEHFDALTARDLGAREALEILLEPVGRVAGRTVLPGGEPQKHEVQVVTPRIPDDAIRHSEVELAFLGFDLGPGNARQDGVEFGVDKPGPERRHVLAAGGAVVAQFSGQRQERLAVDDQLGGGPCFRRWGMSADAPVVAREHAASAASEKMANAP